MTTEKIDNVSPFNLTRTSGTIREAIGSQDLGTAALSPNGSFEAGSWQTFTLTYTAGTYGIDDSGSIRICFRFATDQTKPQFDDPDAANYTTIKASNNAVLEYHYDPKGNVRPWGRTLYIKVVNGYLRKGDTITITFGDTSKSTPGTPGTPGSKGMRLQTFCEDSFEFRVLVDPIATYNYQPLPEQPEIAIVPGKPEKYLAVLPTLRKVGESFKLKLKGEDIWGNPTDQCDATFHIKTNLPVDGLPESVTLTPGQRAFEIDGLKVNEPGDLQLSLQDDEGNTIAEANAMRIVSEAALLPYWVDLHGQTEETIGTNSAINYFKFARDLAFIDACAHQGNDFQITNELFKHLDEICEVVDEDGRFVALPGYEWSGNTALGGDRNVYFPEPGRQIRRSSHALIDDVSDRDTDCVTAADLFNAFAEHGEWDVLMYAHCGGRYADIKLAHDGRFEKSVEIHSSWGTFEWLLHDAFEMGYRVGIVANSDGHKGRPGASYPGAGIFGAIGGLTCMLMPHLSRNDLIHAIRSRHHYATTGGAHGRMHIDVLAQFDQEGTLYHDDPKCFPQAKGKPTSSAMMGDLVHLPSGEMQLHVQISSGSPIERVDIFNGKELIETIRPYAAEDLGSRVRMIWKGAEYRGRFRQVDWTGGVTITDNAITSATPINFFNPNRTLQTHGDSKVTWQTLTTGNFGGVDLQLTDANSGKLTIDTPLVKANLNVDEIGLEDVVFDVSDRLPRTLRVFRLPDVNGNKTLNFSRPISLRSDVDNPVYIRLTQEDGVQAWTSPVYVWR